MQSCYDTYIPDMTLLLDYADYYAEFMAHNGMDNIGFDGFESITHQHQGYYACRIFLRRLYESYHKRTGHYPYITTASCVFGGSWEYFAACNVGGGNHMFNPETGKWGIEGKDIRNAWGAAWFPGTFGIQGWRGKLEDAETLMSMSTAWDATFFLTVSQARIDQSPDKQVIFKAFRAWMEAREKQLFTKAQKEKMKNSSVKFHLEKNADGSFTLFTLKAEKDAAGKTIWKRTGAGERVGR
jgi:hypothetical protein